MQRLTTTIHLSVAKTIKVALAIAFALTLFAAPSIQAQTYQLLHNFTGGLDGANPGSGVTVRTTGTIYGTTTIGGSHGSGIVYKLIQRGSNWMLDPLYEFTGGTD